MTGNNFIMHNKIHIPKIGLGTWLVPNDSACQIVCDAVKTGYRHIDTAQAYENEEGVGDGIQKCGIPREDLFITSKVRAEIKTYKEAVREIDNSIKRLKIEQIDLMLIHCPQPWKEFRGENKYYKENIEVWKALEEAYSQGKLKSIGVSNFDIDDLNNIIDNCSIKPMANQILLHIGNTPVELIEYCMERDILVEAYSPIAHGRALSNDLIIQMAKKYDVSPAQLCIRYTLQLGTVSLPKTMNTKHMKDNLNLNFSISNEDMELLKLSK